jgi:hypothetical protein
MGCPAGRARSPAAESFYSLMQSRGVIPHERESSVFLIRSVRSPCTGDQRLGVWRRAWMPVVKRQVPATVAMGSLQAVVASRPAHKERPHRPDEAAPKHGFRDHHAHPRHRETDSDLGGRRPELRTGIGAASRATRFVARRSSARTTLQMQTDRPARWVVSARRRSASLGGARTQPRQSPAHAGRARRRQDQGRTDFTTEIRTGGLSRDGAPIPPPAGLGLGAIRRAPRRTPTPTRQTRSVPTLNRSLRIRPVCTRRLPRHVDVVRRPRGAWCWRPQPL